MSIGDDDYSQLPDGYTVNHKMTQEQEEIRNEDEIRMTQEAQQEALKDIENLEETRNQQIMSLIRDHQKLIQHGEKYKQYKRLQRSITNLLQIGDGEHVELACKAVEELIAKQTMTQSNEEGDGDGDKYHTVPTGKSRRRHEPRKKARYER